MRTARSRGPERDVARIPSGQFWVAILMALGDEIELGVGELTP
jgi:hypothetical protein